MSDVQAPGGSALEFAAAFARGEVTLLSRPPLEPAAVTSAEALLGAVPRPVYSYVGCLHPSLGILGLVLEPGWVDETLQGATRCDSGGLVGGFGAFEFLPECERPDALLGLSFSPDSIPSWGDEFDAELTSSYGCAYDYISGTRPNSDHWDDPRAEILAYLDADVASADDPEKHDRRVWTWEIRCHPGPRPEQLRYVVLSPEQSNQLEAREQTGENVFPPGLRIITSRITAIGADDHFCRPVVYEALQETA